MRTSFILVAASLFGGCGGSDKPKFMPPDAPRGPDATPVTCRLSPMGAVTPGNPEAHSATADGETQPTNYYYYADLNADPEPDVLMIDLYRDYGAFEAGWPTAWPVTIPLQGDETNYATCGACILAMTDFTQDGATGDPYLATAGTLTLDMVSPTLMKGTLKDIGFTQVFIDPDTAESHVHPDGCSASMTSLAFEATVEPDMQMVRARVTKPARRGKR